MLFDFTKRETPDDDYKVPCVGPYDCGGKEPSIKEVLSDPVIQQIAHSDKISPEDLAIHVEKLRKKIKA